MTRNEVETKVIAITARCLCVNAEEIGLDSNFIEDLYADSLDMVELIMKFEEGFLISVPDDDMGVGNFRTVHSAVDYIMKKL